MTTETTAMTPEATAAEVYQRLTETPEQRQEREMQRFMAEHGLERVEAVRKDGTRRQFLSADARSREAKQRELQAQFERTRNRMALEAARAMPDILTLSGNSGASRNNTGTFFNELRFSIPDFP